MDCVKHQMMQIDNTRRYFICTKLGHLAKNCMKNGGIEDEKKAKVDNIRSRWSINGFQNLLRMQVWAMMNMSLKNLVTQASVLDLPQRELELGF